MSALSTPSTSLAREQSRALMPISRTLFVVWGFPELTQTFIHREMEQFERLGAEVHVLASHRIQREVDAHMRKIADRALYLGPARSWVGRSISYATKHPRRMSELLRWIATMPHRTEVHRARAIGMAWAAASVARQVQARGYRYIHAHFAGYQCELAMCLARLTGLPWGATFHATGIWRDRNLLREKVRSARLLLTCTSHNAEHLRQLAGPQCAHIHLVHHGLDLTRLPAIEPLPPCGQMRWVAAGRLVQKKGFAELLQAIALLRRRGKSPQVKLLGDGPERNRLLRLRQELALEDVVEMPGRIDNDQLLHEMAHAHGLLAPSIRSPSGDMDGIPNVILEAFAAARPVVASHLSGIPEVVQHGVTGLLAPPGNIAALADRMDQLHGDTPRLGAMGTAGRRLVDEKFDVRRNTELQLQLLLQAATVRHATCEQEGADG